MYELGEALNNKAGEEEGRVTCTALYGQYYFVGNGLGEVRVFDLASKRNTRDLRNFVEKQVFGRRVTCISVSEGMQFLVVGYIDGSVVVWELYTCKLVTVQVQLHCSELVSAKIYNVDEDNSLISLVSVEVDGSVFNSKIDRHLRDKSDPEISVNQMYTRLRVPTSIEVLSFDSRRDLKSCWLDKKVVVLGAVSKVIVCTLDLNNEEILNVRRPKVCRENSVAYLDFGFGLCPS